MGSPQVAKGSGSAAEVGCSAPQSRRRAWKVARETRPSSQPFWLPQLGLVRTHPLGLQRDYEKKYNGVPLSHTTLTSGVQASIALLTLQGTRPTQERAWGTRAEAAGAVALLFPGAGEGSRVGVPQVSCSLRLPFPLLALDLRVPWPLTCPSGPELPGVGSQAHTLLGIQLGRQRWLGGGAVSAGRPCTSPCGARGRGPGAEAVAGCCLLALTCSL